MHVRKFAIIRNKIFFTMDQKIRELKFWEKAGYGCGDLASVLFWQTITAYLLYFYTDVFGITAAAAGVMIMVSRVLDGFFDPVIGMVADRTNTRWGKYRPYLLWMSIPLAIASVFAFVIPDFGPSGKLIYAYVTLIVFMFIYSAINIPYSSLLGVISTDPIQRTSAASFKYVGAYLAGSIVSISALPLAKEYFGHGNEAKGWPLTMTVYAIAAVVFFTITFLSTRERIQPMKTQKTTIKNDWKDLLKNKPWIIIVSTTILLILYASIRISVTPHYFKYYVGEQHFSIFGKVRHFNYIELTSAFNFLNQICSIVGVILVPFLAKWIGKKYGFMSLFIISALCTASYYFLTPQYLGLIFFMQIFGSLTGGPLSSLLWAMYADAADYSEFKNNRRATGLVFSATILSQKVGWAIGIAFAGWLLTRFGFQANMVQNINVQNGLKAMMSIIPAAAGIIAIVVMSFYNLDEKTMKNIELNLTDRRQKNTD